METIEKIFDILSSPAIIEIIAIIASWIGGSKWLKSSKMKKISENAKKVYHIVNQVVKTADQTIDKTEEYLKRMDKIIQSYGHAKLSLSEKEYAQSVVQEIHNVQKMEKMEYIQNIAYIAYLAVCEYERKNPSNKENGESNKTELFFNIINSFLISQNYTPLSDKQKEAAKNIAKNIHFQEKEFLAISPDYSDQVNEIIS